MLSRPVEGKVRHALTPVRVAPPAHNHTGRYHKITRLETLPLPSPFAVETTLYRFGDPPRTFYPKRLETVETFIIFLSAVIVLR